MLTMDEVLTNHLGLIKQLVYEFQVMIPGYHHDGEDFFQEVIIAIHKRLSKYNKKLSQPTTFLHRVVRNKLLDILRRECSRIENIKMYNFSTLESEKNTYSQGKIDCKIDFPVDMPVDALLIEKELIESISRKLPEDAVRYMQVCLNPPDDMVKWIDKKQREAGPKPRRSNLPKNRIVEYLNKQGEEKWATNARLKLRSALMNLFPNI